MSTLSTFTFKTILEYIWIGGKGEIRSKTRVIHKFIDFDINYIPEWNYDGSSTWQADSDNDTEIILKPCFMCKDVIRKIDEANCYLVLCDTYYSNGKPTKTNHRYLANKIFENGKEYEPWFGLEQEYFMEFENDKITTKYDNDNNDNDNDNGFHYCGQSKNYLERKIAEEHMILCIETGIQISGINSEVSNYQWEFQVGPCEGISAGDHLIISRYLLERVSEKYNVKINYHPKPFRHINGSGCHINFSTKLTRTSNMERGLKEIYHYINCLSNFHAELIKVYGDYNDLRLTGIHETSSYKNFSWGVGTRNTSIRIPNQTIVDKCGYFEDRRPASNIDPYLATSKLFNICYEKSEKNNNNYIDGMSIILA